MANTSELFLKYKKNLETLIAIYGGNAKLYDLLHGEKSNG